MAARWTAAGSRAELAVYPGGVHGFNLFPLAITKEMARRCHTFVSDALG
jgi:acetyl esterase